MAKIIEGILPENDLQRAFVAGAKWWEFYVSDGTMWQSDVRLVESEAKKRYVSTKNQDWSNNATKHSPHN